jgi:hypothetical protein
MSKSEAKDKEQLKKIFHESEILLIEDNFEMVQTKELKEENLLMK